MTLFNNYIVNYCFELFLLAFILYVIFKDFIFLLNVHQIYRFEHYRELTAINEFLSNKIII